MTRFRAAALTSALVTACAVALATPASADSGNCQDWWTVDDTTLTVFTDSTQTVKFWGHRSCGGTRTPAFRTADYRPDGANDLPWAQMKARHGNTPGAVAYGYELRAETGGGWLAVSFAASHG